MRQKKHIYIVQKLDEKTVLPELEKLVDEGILTDISITIHDNGPQEDKTAPILELFDQFFKKKKNKTSPKAVKGMVENPPSTKKPQPKLPAAPSWAMFQALIGALDDLNALKEKFDIEQRKRRWSYEQEDVEGDS